MEKILALSFLSTAVFFCFCASAQPGDFSTKKILTIIASSNFRDEEILIPKKIFEENGFTVVIASSSLKPAKGMLGGQITPDILIDKAAVDDYDAIVFIGGSGSSEYWNNKTAHRIAKEAVEKNKVLAAICIAPVTLANAGVLSGKRATVWFSEKDALTKCGATYTGSAVETDGNIITANGPQAASKFAETILTKL